MSVFEQYDPLMLIMLCLAGFFAGGINTVAGGGSNLTLPVLMMLGLPPEVANGTNRVSVTLQCVVSLAGFNRYDTLDHQAIVPILIPTVLGGILGALLAAMMPGLYLKPILLGTILLMSIIILIKPSTISPPPGAPTRSPGQHRGAWLGLFGSGIYGGFVQAGVGFILLAALAGGLRYDLLRANALKTVCALAFTSVAMVVFIVFGQVWWIPGLILSLGSMLGAYLAVRIAVNVPQHYLKWFLFAMTVAACIGGFLY